MADNSDKDYINRFYKKTITGRKGNVFTRLEWLEEHTKRTAVKDITQIITNIVNENKEIIVPSIVGGTQDPSDPAFSGIVISPSGQMIDGVLYSYAWVVEGVVMSGIPDTGNPDPPAPVNNDIVVGVAGASLSYGHLIYLSSTDGRWEKADASTVGTCKNRLGICILAAAADGDATTILLKGNVIDNVVFPTMTVGVPMYASIVSGEISSSPPNTTAGEIIRHVGYALSATELYFNPSSDFFEIG